MSKCIIENANRSMTSGYINPDNYTPLPKNPAIAGFFREIHMAEELGSGVRNIFKYGKHYTNFGPILEEGDIFKFKIGLYVADIQQKFNLADKSKKSADKPKKSADIFSEIMHYATEHQKFKVNDIQELLNLKESRSRQLVAQLCNEGKLIKHGAGRATYYTLSE